MRVYIGKDYDEMSRIAANVLSAQVTMKPDCVLGLATGSTPIGTYKVLIERCANGDLDFSKVKSINLDEYVGLSGEHDQSYRYFMNHNLFDHINIDKANTNVPNGLAEDGAAEGARYEALIASLGGIDLQILGIGHLLRSDRCTDHRHVYSGCHDGSFRHGLPYSRTLLHQLRQN